MATAIVAYDLKNVKADDNAKVKKAIVQRYTNTSTHFDSPNLLSYVPEWVRLRLPDTTIFVERAMGSTDDAAAEIVSLIKSVGAEPGAVFVAYIGEHTLWNADKQLLKLT
jgi:hypothetical protein